MIKGLPIYQAKINDEEDGIIRISLVDRPAVDSDFEFYDKVEEPKLYDITDEEEHIVTGCFLRADYPILRKMGEQYYYVIFSKETIKEMVQKWVAEGRTNIINEAHQENTDVEDLYLQEVYIKDTSKGINPVGYEDVENGSAFATYKVLNDDVWEDIKNGTFKGFSIECYHEIELVIEENDDELMDDIISLLEKLNKIKK